MGHGRREAEEGHLLDRVVEEVKEDQNEPIYLSIESQSQPIDSNVDHASSRRDSQAYQRVGLAPHKSSRAYLLVALAHNGYPRVYQCIALTVFGFE